MIIWICFHVVVEPPQFDATQHCFVLLVCQHKVCCFHIAIGNPWRNGHCSHGKQWGMTVSWHKTTYLSIKTPATVLPLPSKHVDSVTNDRETCKEGNGSVTGLRNRIMKHNLCQSYLLCLGILFDRAPSANWWWCNPIPPQIPDGLAWYEGGNWKECWVSERQWL